LLCKEEKRFLLWRPEERVVPTVTVAAKSETYRPTTAVYARLLVGRWWRRSCRQRELQRERRKQSRQDDRDNQTGDDRQSATLSQVLARAPLPLSSRDTLVDERRSSALSTWLRSNQRCASLRSVPRKGAALSRPVRSEKRY